MMPSVVYSALATEHADRAHERFERIAEPPLLVGRIEVVRRHHDGDSRQLRRVQQVADVSDGAVLGDAVADHRPRRTVGAEEVNLRTRDDERGVFSRSNTKPGFGSAGFSGSA